MSAERTRPDQVTRRQFLKFAAGTVAASTLAACAPAAAPAPSAPASSAGAGQTQPTESAPPAPAASGGTLTLGYAQKTSFSHFMHMRHFAGSEAIYSKRFANAKLITSNNDFTAFTPDLAKEWAFSEDGLTLTFKLREGLTWHDGEPFTAHDVWVTFHMISLPTGSYTMGLNFAPFIPGFQEYVDGDADSIEGMTVLDDHTIVFQMFEPFSEALLMLAFNGVTIAPAHIVEPYMDRTKSESLLQSEWATTAQHVGIGPFRVVEYVPDQQIVYEPFENYYRGKPLLDKLVYVPFADAQTLVAALENREINAGARLPMTEYERLQELDYLKFHNADSPTLLGANMNNRKPYLNAKVRQGLLYAVDREAMVQALYGGATSVAHTPLRVAGLPDSPNLTQYSYDPVRARQLLEEGGWDFERKIRWAVSAAPSDSTFFDTVNGYWAEVGVQSEYQIFGAERDGIATDPWDFDLISSAWPKGYPSQIALHYDTRNCTNWCVGNDNQRLLELFDETKYRLSPEELQAKIWEMQDIISSEAMFFWTVHTPDIWGMDKGVMDFKPVYTPYETTYNDWDMEKVWVQS